MKLNSFLIKISAIVVVIFTIVSCDDDFNAVGSEVLGDINFEDLHYSATPVITNKVFDRVQTSGLPVNLLGVYTDPNFENVTTTYSILSQVGLPGNVSPSYPDGAQLKSVVLNLPYFSRSIGTEEVEVISNSNDDTVVEIKTNYELDSIYGNDEIRLSIYKSNYFLADFDPGSEQRKVYYSNDIASFGSEIEDLLLYTKEDFKPSSEEVVIETGEVDNDGVTQFTRERLSPRLRVVFPEAVTTLFQSLFIDKEGDPEFSNANNFRNFFRGIYFKVDPADGKSNLVYFNMANANITLNYTYDQQETNVDLNEDGDTDDLVEQDGELVLSFSNNIVNSIQNPVSSIENIVDNNNNLYLKGGEGSYAVLDLFNRFVETNADGTITLDQDGNPNYTETPDLNDITELEFLRNQQWLIKDATIKLYVNDTETPNEDAEPERIYIFNIETGTILIDYCFDPTLNTNQPINSGIFHLGRLNRDDNGDFYQIKLTRHLISILDGDTDNVKLGISVSQNINVEAGQNCIPTSPADADGDFIPFSSIISHEGTVIYGNTNNVPESRSLKLDIFYTRSKDN
ncbi:DUF4270 domain-containing protein [Aquimarina sp. MMG016]|uniref:DUF4270 domain-containing protein n=1 Tax=Aquimarina sp. MMG016 TaxID=2822690 RepID=UPI001B3A771F|nr:DUF4270 domain-containing protein [Aquimarina sp. MMG016]MBQ4819989.1 DUF4270 domain-containing protein [Aquimarina sp. MMG016]